MYNNAGQMVNFPGMPMNPQQGTIDIAGARFPSGGGQVLPQSPQVNALANYYRSQPGGQMPGANPGVPSPGGAGLSNLAPTANEYPAMRGIRQTLGLGGLSPQVRALMQQYQANQALQNSMAGGQMMPNMQQAQWNLAQSANPQVFNSIMTNPNLTDAQRNMALQMPQGPQQPWTNNPSFWNQGNAQPAPQQPAMTPMQRQAMPNGLTGGAAGLARYYQR